MISAWLSEVWGQGGYPALAVSFLLPLVLAAWSTPAQLQPLRSRSAARQLGGYPALAVSFLLPLVLAAWSTPLGRHRLVPLDVADWQRSCDTFDTCPWGLDSCDTLDQVFQRVWREPLPEALRQSVQSLRECVKDGKVARCGCNYEGSVTVYCLIYVLTNGAELFGGAPMDLPIGLDLELDEAGDEGLHQRRRPAAAQHRPKEAGPHLPASSLSPFYRVHDGFGVLVSRKHLPMILASPEHELGGSRFYVYPVNAIKPHWGRPKLLKFARVDIARDVSDLMCMMDELSSRIDMLQPQMSNYNTTASHFAGNPCQTMVAGECVGCYYARMKGATTSLLGNSCQQVTTDAVTGDCEGNACSSSPSVPLVLGNACLSASVADVLNVPVAADGVISDAYHAQVKSFYLCCT